MGKQSLFLNKLKAKQWRYKPFILSVIPGNVNLLTNKTDELAALFGNRKIYLYRVAVSKDIPGFTNVRVDRDTKKNLQAQG